MGRTPVHSEHPSRPSFDRDFANNLELLQQAPQNHEDAKRKVCVTILPLIYLNQFKGSRTR